MHGDNGDDPEAGTGSDEPRPAARTATEATWADGVPDVVEAVIWGVWSFVVFSSTITLFWFDAGSLGYYLCLEVWIASGWVMSYPTPEREVARRLHRLQPPTTMETERLNTAWAAVARRAGPTRLVCHPDTRTVSVGRFRVTLHPCRVSYRLWVVDAGAAATTPASKVGYPVTVTRWAVHSLPPARLEAVVAHQLRAYYQLDDPGIRAMAAKGGVPDAELAARLGRMLGFARRR